MDKSQMVELRNLLQESNELSAKPSLTAQEKTRFAYCLAAIAALRSGASVEDVHDLYREDAAKRGGITLPPKNSNQFYTRAQEAEAREWKEFVEQRNMTEGNVLARIGTYTHLGFFVPTGFYPELFRALKQHDCLFDEAAVTVIKSTNGRPLPVPLAGDTTEIAVPIEEGNVESVVDIDNTHHLTLGSFTFRTPRFVCSLEAFEDMEGTLSTVNILREFSADRIGRGIGKFLVLGSGSAQPLGLAASMIANACPVVTAGGSAVNDGSSATGANSLGSPDFAAAVKLFDDAYAQSPKAAWFMNKRTLATLEALTDKVGHPLNLVRYETNNGETYPCIMGFRVRIAPSMDDIGVPSFFTSPSIGSGALPVVLADGRYWVTRLIQDENSGIRVYKEADGLIESGNVAFRTFVRADGGMAYASTSDPSPFIGIQNT